MVTETRSQLVADHGAKRDHENQAEPLATEYRRVEPDRGDDLMVWKNDPLGQSHLSGSSQLEATHGTVGSIYQPLMTQRCRMLQYAQTICPALSRAEVIEDLSRSS